MENGSLILAGHQRKINIIEAYKGIDKDETGLGWELDDYDEETNVSDTVIRLLLGCVSAPAHIATIPERVESLENWTISLDKYSS